MADRPTGRLERDDGPPLLRTSPGLLLYGEDRPAGTADHRQPVWKVVVALDGELVVDRAGRRGTASALLVPPGVRHSMAATGAYRCLQVEPWVDPLVVAVGPVLLPATACAPLAAELVRPAADDLAALGRVLVERVRCRVPLPPRPPVQERVRVAASLVGTADSLADLATEVGLSPVRLRELVRRELGVPLGQLRLWARLASSASAGAGGFADRAVQAGFSDQAHLTRTSRRMAGRTPGDLLRRR